MARTKKSKKSVTPAAREKLKELYTNLAELDEDQQLAYAEKLRSIFKLPLKAQNPRLAKIFELVQANTSDKTRPGNGHEIGAATQCIYAIFHLKRKWVHIGHSYNYLLQSLNRHIKEAIANTDTDTSKLYCYLRQHYLKDVYVVPLELCRAKYSNEEAFKEAAVPVEQKWMKLMRDNKFKLYNTVTNNKEKSM